MLLSNEGSSPWPPSLPRPPPCRQSRSLIIKSCVRSYILFHRPVYIAAFSVAARSVSTTDAIALHGLLSPGGDGEIRSIVNEIGAESRERAKKEALW